MLRPAFTGAVLAAVGPVRGGITYKCYGTAPATHCTEAGSDPTPAEFGECINPCNASSALGVWGAKVAGCRRDNNTGLNYVDVDMYFTPACGGDSSGRRSCQEGKCCDALFRSVGIAFANCTAGPGNMTPAPPTTPPPPAPGILYKCDTAKQTCAEGGAMKIYDCIATCTPTPAPKTRPPHTPKPPTPTRPPHTLPPPPPPVVPTPAPPPAVFYKCTGKNTPAAQCAEDPTSFLSKQACANVCKPPATPAPAPASGWACDQASKTCSEGGGAMAHDDCVAACV